MPVASRWCGGVTAAVVAAVVAIGCGSSGGNSPTSPTASTPQGTGCSGAAISNVTVGVGPRSGSPSSAQGTVEVYGETVSFSAPPTGADQQFYITRNVVPCDYEVVVRVTSGTGPFNMTFGFPPRTTAPSSGGVDLNSIEVVEAPPQSAVFNQAKPACDRAFGDGGTRAPFTIRMRFRVVAGLSESARC